jgi:hypothetical protein
VEQIDNLAGASRRLSEGMGYEADEICSSCLAMAAGNRDENNSMQVNMFTLFTGSFIYSPKAFLVPR